MTTAAELADRVGLDRVAIQQALGVDPGRVVVRPMPALLDVVLPRWVAAMALPRTIYLRDPGRVTPRLLAHELAHCGQWARWGVSRFALTYGVGLLRALLSSRGVRGSVAAVPLEVEAERLARELAG